MTRPVLDAAFTSAPVTVVAEHGGRDAVRRARFLAAGLLASEQVGVARNCLDSTMEYLLDRKQFGRQLGSYQALKHRLADLWVELTEASAVARYAATTADVFDDDYGVTAALAHAYCSDVTVKAAEEMTQLHGGIAFTWEHPAHMLLKRAKSSALTFGTPYAHRAHLGGILGGGDG